MIQLLTLENSGTIKLNFLNFFLINENHIEK